MPVQVFKIGGMSKLGTGPCKLGYKYLVHLVKEILIYMEMKAGQLFVDQNLSKILKKDTNIICRSLRKKQFCKVSWVWLKN